MKKITKIISTCLLINNENIDTDQIVPARFLRLTTKVGFGKYLFYDWRFDKNGKPKQNKEFGYLNHHISKILVVGNNFGCGSSREHAVWALQDFGFAAVISSSFGNIFYNNSFKSGFLPIVIKPQELKNLFKEVKEHPQTGLTVDLENQKINVGNKYIFKFPIDKFRKTCLLNGIDELGYILSHEELINKFEDKHKNFISL